MIARYEQSKFLKKICVCAGASYDIIPYLLVFVKSYYRLKKIFMLTADIFVRKSKTRLSYFKRVCFSVNLNSFYDKFQNIVHNLVFVQLKQKLVPCLTVDPEIYVAAVLEITDNSVSRAGSVFADRVHSAA